VNFTVEEEKKARGECKPGEGIDKAREWAKVMRRMVAACLKLQITAPSLVLKIREVRLNEKHALRRLEGESETGWGMKVQEDFRYSEWVWAVVGRWDHRYRPQGHLSNKNKNRNTPGLVPNLQIPSISTPVHGLFDSLREPPHLVLGGDSI